VTLIDRGSRAGPVLSADPLGYLNDDLLGAPDVAEPVDDRVDVIDEEGKARWRRPRVSTGSADGRIWAASLPQSRSQCARLPSFQARVGRMIRSSEASSKGTGT
jgi:hypothetical protein